MNSALISNFKVSSKAKIISVKPEKGKNVKMVRSTNEWKCWCSKNKSYNETKISWKIYWKDHNNIGITYLNKKDLETITQLPERLFLFFDITHYGTFDIFDNEEILEMKERHALPLITIRKHKKKDNDVDKRNDIPKFTWKAKIYGMKIFPRKLGSGPSINFWST